MGAVSHRSSFLRRGSALIVALATSAFSLAAAAQPLDPYAPEKPAPKAKAPKAPKAPKEKDKAKATPAAPPSDLQDPYGDAAPQPAPPAQPAPAPPAPAPPAPQPQSPPTGPQDPYAPAPAPTPRAPGPVDEQAVEIDEAVAAALVARAHHLLDVQAWADAKQLAVESLVRSPSGASAADAKQIVHLANQRLGIPDDEPVKPPPTQTAQPLPLPPADDAAAMPAVTAHAEGAARGSTVLGGYGVLGGALLGMAVVGAGDGISDAGDDAIGASIGAVAGGLGSWWAGSRYDVSFADARTIGAGASWGAVTFGLLTDVVGGSDVHTSHDEIMVGSSIGLALGTLGGVAYASNHVLSANDVTVVDSLATMGAIGGFSVGELMQPYANEAYSLNAALGAAGGVVVGLYLAPDHEASTARMARIDGLAALGAGLPWAVYGIAHSSDSTADERVFGLLSAAGMLTGAYVGLRWTDGMDDVPDTSKKSVEVGALGVRPAITPLAPSTGRGLVVDVLRASW